MANSGGIITAPINVETDVYKVLGIGPTAQGYDIGNACSNAHGKINWRSKKKPIRWNSKNINLTNINWWKAENGDCGLVPSVTGPLNSVINGKWNYAPPDGSHEKRILDFENYNHNAGNPINHGYNSGIDINKATQKTLYIMFATPDNEPYEFSPADMYSLRETYLTAYFVMGSQHQFKVSAENPIKEIQGELDALTIAVPASEFKVGEYMCYLVFSTARFILGQTEPSANFYPYISDVMNPSNFKIRVTNIAPVEVIFTSLSYAANGEFITIEDAGDITPEETVPVMYTNGDIAVIMTVRNKSGDAVSFLRNQLRMDTQTLWGTNIVRDGTMYDGNTITQGITVSAGQTRTIKMLFPSIILYNGNDIQTPNDMTRFQSLFATMRWYSVDGYSWSAAGGSVIYNVKYSRYEKKWAYESVNQ